MKTTTLLTAVWTLIPFVFGFPRPHSDLPGFRHIDNGADGSANESSEADAHRDPHNILPRDKNETQLVHPVPAYEVTCGRQKQQINKEAFDEAFAYFKQWCDSDEGEARPFDNYFIDYADVRIAVCNWGLWNPCRGDEMETAWSSIDDKCPGAGEGDDDATVADGLWYEPSWLKGYWRGNCTTGLVCQGNQRGIACRNEGEGTWIKGGREG
ncbi:hypothetical protein PG985_011439 [Apiospora marii]|uniref:Uncharacterized protein n=1 Tax=Apiospora marii TaxID=335849 RepID=A0ABR1SW00_9PEZI